ncbi:LacI family transcriptional regulator [Palleronia aestuarii]|uniref:LacI family transcriptional regulator n=1 Tax=Palleronia aestuarii TaxID=568105 RepID=A0A2W7NBL4_9RHOB|nr:substrate-binding domain-containing protein [Palleronia aestuarii]PZX17528.1 LacI family transcriptional regulator [Palleronia aestuarii]
MNLKQLAELLDLSQTTVSRALNGYPEVGEHTRRRVLEAAQTHHYRPNSWAKRLATGRSNAVAHILPMRSEHEVMNPVFADFISGASAVYAEAGFDMILSIVDHSEELSAYRDLASRHSVEGLLVHAPHGDDPRIALLNELGLPFVVHGRVSASTQAYSWLDLDNRQAFERGTRHLLDLGHRRIALLNGLDVMDFAQRRRSGFEAALASRGIDPDPDIVCGSEMTEAFGHSSASRMLGHRDPPTAFLVSSLIIAIGVRRACEEHGFVLGRDVSLVSHDDDLGYFRDLSGEPYFTAIRSPVRDHGRRAARMLLDIIRTGDRRPRTELLQAELHLGRSTGPAPVRPVNLARG